LVNTSGDILQHYMLTLYVVMSPWGVYQCKDLCRPTCYTDSWADWDAPRGTDV